MLRTSVFYFVALLAVVIVGFWKTYFSKLLGDITFAQHFHAIVMLLWVSLLISQAWLIRSRNNKIHRNLGKVSFILAPLVIFSAMYVVLDSLSRQNIPYTEGALSIFWFGIFLALLFTTFYSLAIYHRKNMQLHARAMICTGLVFLVPALTRVFGFVIAPMGVPVPGIYGTMIIASLIGVALIYSDWRKGKIYAPFVILTAAWGINLILFRMIANFEWWHSFAAWSIRMVT